MYESFELDETSDSLKKIIILSGGQTGADRAALDFALSQGISCGGWCPSGRLAEDGPIDSHYPLRECRSDRYSVRTEKNVRDSDATIIFTLKALSGGSRLTADYCEKYDKPYLHLNLSEQKVEKNLEILENFLAPLVLEKIVFSLNIAGQRASQAPDIYDQTHEILSKIDWEMLLEGDQITKNSL